MNNKNITFKLLEKIESANRDFSLFDGCKKLLVGLSGGADSTCLLLSLKELSRKYGFELYALHINHKIRGVEADRDQKFAKSLCESHNISFFCEVIDIPSLAKEQGVSLELCARNARYDAFNKVCLRNGISHVATAHNACDNTETVLFNLTRGTSIKGLCGIPPKRYLSNDVTIIRPLLYATRSEIEEYLRFHKQDFVTDSTNLESDYTRNFFRNEITPLLKKINPDLDGTIIRSSNLLRKDEDYLSHIAKNSVTDKLDELSNLHESILSRVITILFSQVCGETLEKVHIDALCSKIYEYKSSRKLKAYVSLPGNMRCKIQNGVLSFEKDLTIESKTGADYSVEVTGEGVFEISDTDFAFSISFDNETFCQNIIQIGQNVYKIYTTDYLYFDTIPKCLTVRNRKFGDKILLNGQHKSLKRLMCQYDFEDSLRFTLPLLCHNSRILVLPKVSVCDLFKSSNDYKHKMVFSVYRKI